MKASKYLMYLLPLAIFLIVRFAFDFNGLYGQDSHEYLRYTNALLSFFQTSEDPGDYFWPVYYPMIGAVISFVVGHPIFVLQIISLLAFLGSIYFLGEILKQIYPELANETYLTLALALSPLCLQASMVGMSDMLSVFWITGAFWSFLAYRENKLSKYLLLFSFFSFSAVMTRYVAGLVLLVPGLLVIYYFLRQPKIFAGLAAVGIAGLCVLPHYLIRQQGAADFLGHGALSEWSIAHLFQQTFTTAQGTYTFKLPNIIYIVYNFVHPGFLFLGLIIIPFIRKQDFGFPVKIALFIVLIYGLFIGGLETQNKRFLLVTFPFVLIIMLPAFLRFLDFLKKSVNQKLVVGIIATVQVLLFAYTIHPIIERNHLEKEIAYSLLDYPNKTIYAFDVDVSFSSYNVKNRVINFWTEPIGKFESKSLAVFNEPGLSEQWAGTNVMNNWKRLNRQHDLTVLQEFSNGWKLYEIR